MGLYFIFFCIFGSNHIQTCIKKGCLVDYFRLGGGGGGANTHLLQSQNESINSRFFRLFQEIKSISLNRGKKTQSIHKKIWFLKNNLFTGAKLFKQGSFKTGCLSMLQLQKTDSWILLQETKKSPYLSFIHWTHF